MIIQSKKSMKINSLKYTINRPSQGHLPASSNRKATLPSISTAICRGQDIFSMGWQASRYRKGYCNEVQLNNSKWLVFDQEQERKGVMYGSVNKRGRGIDRKKKGNRSVKQNMHIITDYQQKKAGHKGMIQIKGKNHEGCLESPLKTQKLKQSRKVTLISDEKRSIHDMSPCHSSSKFKSRNKSSKSNKSLKSATSNRTIKNSKVNHEVLDKNASIVKKDNEKEKEEVRQIDVECEALTKVQDNTEEGSRSIWEKIILLAQIYDKIELLNPNLMKGLLCSNPYDDFPQLKQINTTSILPSLQNQQKQQQYIPPSIPSLSPQLEACIQSVISKSISPQPQKQQIATPQKDQQPCLSQQAKRQLQVLTQIIEQKNVNANQCLTTSSTQPHQKIQPNNLDIPSIIPEQQQLNITSLMPIILSKQQSFRDRSFDQLSQFSPYKQIRLIQIDPNQQTALLPFKFTSQYLRPIPSTSSLHNLFKNQQMLSFLNHIIFSQPDIIQNLFGKPNKNGYCSNLFEDGQRKKVVVDGLFPFDANYYPLYGFFDQFIWFSVLVKCIAKMKGSYASLNELTYLEIYQILTGITLISFNLKLNEFKTLKQFKNLLKNAQQSKTIMMFAKKQDRFYKISKIQSIKPIPKVKQVYRNQYSNKTSNSSEEDNFRSLNFFLKKQIKVYEKNQLHESTLISLKGYNSKQKLTFKQFLDEGFEVYVSSNIRQVFSQSKAKIQALGQYF